MLANFYRIVGAMGKSPKLIYSQKRFKEQAISRISEICLHLQQSAGSGPQWGSHTPVVNFGLRTT